MATLKLAQASAIVDAAITEGRQKNFSPLAVAVLDAGGHLIAFKREDGAGIVRFDIAYGKAWGALGMGFGTRELAERALKFPTFVAALSAISQGRMVPSPGGVLIIDAEEEVVGAVGISGDTGDNDEVCAIAGIEAIGLSAIPGSAGGRPFVGAIFQISEECRLQQSTNYAPPRICPTNPDSVHEI